MPLTWFQKTRAITRRMMTINIYLIGMMGSGKSTIGQLLADRLNMPWLDMDEIIEKKRYVHTPYIREIRRGKV